MFGAGNDCDRLSNLSSEFNYAGKLGPFLVRLPQMRRVASKATRPLEYGMKYMDQDAKIYEAQHPPIGQLKWNAAKLGFRVVEVAA
jgi:hypothetical protein